ncbi:hypothetical protein M2138_001517 [Dysgonomonadaceae bacterium PH5-43]|nr:hypothetical protein [Dysgonomonadaceae bacterium PH5-43]
MKRIIIITFVALLSSLSYLKAEECDVKAFYLEVEADNGAKAIDEYGNFIKIEKLLVPDNSLKDGKYSVSVTRKGSNMYKVDGTDYYIETSYCYEYAIMDDAVLIVKSYGNRKYGTLVFLD